MPTRISLNYSAILTLGIRTSADVQRDARYLPFSHATRPLSRYTYTWISGYLEIVLLVRKASIRDN